ncbi:MAG: hypothetical protein ACE5FU_06915 [Nitrospinota bacterium]
MLKNITLSAEENLIKKARKQAGLEKTTLNALFRKWLERYSGKSEALTEYDEIMKVLHYVKSGGKFSRDEMNER